MATTQGDSGSGLHPTAQILIREKLRILCLLRALDRAGVDPAEDHSVRVPLVRLGELDAFLTALLDLADREGSNAEADLGEEIRTILPVAEAVRGDVRDAVPARYRKALRRASSQVVASEAEILLELDAFRRDARAGGHRRGPVSEAEAEAIAEATWSGPGRTARLQLDRRVDEHERKALPDDEAPLRAWFDRTPRPWRAAMMRIHGLRGKSADPIALRLARRVGDPTWMRHFLTERCGTSEREMLARLLAVRAVPVAPGEALHEAFFVDWDWGSQFPAGTGAKLRAAGLVHVGTEAGTRLATIPAPLVPGLRELLAEVDPESAALPERAARHVEATLRRDAPFEDATLDTWKRVDRAFSERLERWLLDSRDRLAGAVDAVFEGLERAVYSEPDAGAIFEYGILDWRETPDEPTFAERRVEETRFASPQELALARAVVSSRPALYRVESAERETSVRLAPLFPEGEAVDVTDRSMSLTIEPGQLVALRVYPAGRFHFARAFGPPIEAELEKVLVRALRRDLRAIARDGGAEDGAALLRDRPWVFLRVLRRHWN
jgi:hypothetical protein